MSDSPSVPAFMRRAAANRAALLKGPVIISVACHPSGPGTYTRYTSPALASAIPSAPFLRGVEGAEPVRTGSWLIERKRAQEIYDRLAR